MLNKVKTESQKKENPRAPKGMRDIIGEKFFEYQGFYEKAAEVAIYYGFTPIETPFLEQEEVFTRTAGEASDIVEKELYSLKTKGGDRLALRPEFTAGVMRAYMENGMQSLPQPVMLYSFGPVFRHDRPQRGRFRDPRQFNLEILGSDKSISDAMTIHVIYMILREVGVPNISFEVNSVGDKECRGIFRRELTNYYKKHLGELCRDCLRRLKDNPLRLLDCKTCTSLKEGAPSSISFLCEECKRHFKEVLEYLEALGIPYTVNNWLVRGFDYYTRTAFEVFSLPNEEVVAPESGTIETVEGEGEKVEKKEVKEVVEEEAPALLALGGGGRYDYLAKELGSNKPVPAMGAALGVDRVIALADRANLIPRILKKPKVYFIQLGFEAKLKSLGVVEILHQAKIPLMHSLSKDGLGAQLATAEKLKIPYTIILGQKEVIEESVIVRDMSNRSQKSVPLAKLADYIKKLK